MPSCIRPFSLFALSLVSSRVLANVATDPVLNAPGSWGAPCLIQIPGDGFYTFATNNQLAHVPVAFSPDFKTWNLVTNSKGTPIDAMPTLPAWTDPNNPAIWGPDVNLLDDGTYIMYFAGMNQATNTHCVGYALSNTIAGPYTPNNSTWFCPGGGDQAIDPDGFHDPSTGKRYVTYKWNQASKLASNVRTSYINGCGPQQPPYPPTPIMIQEVDVDGITKIGNMTQLVNNNGNSDCGNTESPSMMLDSAGNYVLYFSTGYFGDFTYTVSYAVANSVLGPYTRAAQPFLATGDYNMRGPGTADVLNTGLYMVLFAQNEDQPNNSYRELRTALVSVASNETVIGNGTLPNGGNSNGGSSTTSIPTPNPNSNPSKTGSAGTGSPSNTSGSHPSGNSGTSGAEPRVNLHSATFWTILLSSSLLSMTIMLAI